MNVLLLDNFNPKEIAYFTKNMSQACFLSFCLQKLLLLVLGIHLSKISVFGNTQGLSPKTIEST